MLGDKCCQFALSLGWTLGKLLQLPQACSVQAQDSYSHTEIRVRKEEERKSHDKVIL